ncbi:MAG TPA: polysaccharide deacetylase family protein [Candidatus Binatia bacterium]|nr:polysaccharide deacetylase family protein [Candidatus Binatia bacterium]
MPHPPYPPRRPRRPTGAPALSIALLVGLVAASCGSPTPSASPVGSAPSPLASAGGSPSASGEGSAPPTTEPPGTGSPPPSPSGPASPTTAASPTPFVYVVVPGDTLTSIARRFATDVRSISYWNRDRYPSLDPDSPDYDPNTIVAGWQLLIVPGVVLSDDEIPTPRPTTTPIPTLTLPPAPTPPAGTSLLISSGPRGSNAVALTLDMGGRLDPALDIMDWLIANGVPATIFPTGKIASTTAVGRAVIERAAAHPDLFRVGNHSWDHPNFTTLSAAQMVDQLERTEAVIEPTTGRSTRPWFRPPYGAQNATVRAAVGGAGWSYTVMWDIDTIDWKPESDGGPTTDDIVAKVLSRVQGGSIVLMHLGGYHTLEALPRIVEGLRERGLVPVTLDTMFGR